MGGRNTARRLRREANELLHRVIQLADSPVRLAWAWFDLARVLAWLGEPESEVVDACRRAIEAVPDEPRFTKWLADRQTRKRP